MPELQHNVTMTFLELIAIGRTHVLPARKLSYNETFTAMTLTNE